MTTFKLFVIALAAGAAAHADFSYTSTRKMPNMPGAAGGDQVTKQYLKGQKMMTDLGSSAILIDFDAQTVTNINHTQKTYTVSKVSDVTQGPAGPDINVSAQWKETGEHKVVGGFNATQSVVTMDMDMSQMAQRPGMKMQMEMEIWASPDVPGASEMEAFYKRNMSRFPWAAMGAGGNASARSAMAELQKKMAAMHGVPVLEVMHTKMAGGPTLSPEQQAQMDKARAQMEAMQKQGGPQAAAAAQAMARMGMASSGGGGSEITIQMSGFSTAPIPDSVFAIPADYHQNAK